jgi:hypothetical protein
MVNINYGHSPECTDMKINGIACRRLKQVYYLKLPYFAENERHVKCKCVLLL